MQCEYISESEIKQHVVQDQMEQLEIIEAGKRRDHLNSTPGRSKIFNIPGLQALSGALTASSPTEKIPAARPRVKSDYTPYLATFGERLSSRNQAQLTGSNDSKDVAVASRPDQVPSQFKLEMMRALGPQDGNVVVPSIKDQINRLSGADSS